MMDVSWLTIIVWSIMMLLAGLALGVVAVCSYVERNCEAEISRIREIHKSELESAKTAAFVSGALAQRRRHNPGEELTDEVWKELAKWPGNRKVSY